MKRDMIVPDCLVFYLLSLYPIPDDGMLRQLTCDLHIGKIQWLVNKAVGRKVFRTQYVEQANKYIRHHKGLSYEKLLLMARLP